MLRRFTFISIIAALMLATVIPAISADVRITMSTATQEAINAGTLKMIEILKTKGIIVDMVEHSGGAKTAQAVLAGQVEFGMGGADECMIAVANGAPIQAFSPSLQPRINYVVVARAGIKSLADLVGKNFGISGTSGFDNILARIAFTRSGINPETVKWTQIGGSSARSQALAAGRVDAVTIFLPNWIDLKSKGDFVKVVSLAELFPTLTQSVYMAKTEWIEKNPTIVKAIIEAVIETQKWAYNNKEQWLDTAMGFLVARDRAVLAETYDEFKKMGMFAVNGGLSKSGSIELNKLLVQSGDMPVELPLEKWMHMKSLEPFLLN